MRHLQQARKLHERLALDVRHMLRWHPMRWHGFWRRGRWGMFLRWRRFWRSLAVVRAAHLALDQRRSALVQAGRNTVLAPVARRLLIVLAGARAIHNVVHHRAVTLAGHFGLAIVQELDIMVE